MLTAQQMQDKVIERMAEELKKQTEEEKEQQRMLLKGFLAENEQNSSKGTSSSPSDSKPSVNRKPRDIVEDVMQTYEFSREEALEELEAFDW